METGFRTYATRKSLEEAREIARILEQAGIPGFIEENKKISSEDATDGGESRFDLQLKQEDFSMADQVMQERAYRLAEEAEESFLISLSDDELMDVVYKYDEWGDANYAIARRLLAKHGKSLSDQYIKSLREKRWKEISKPERANPVLIVIGYLSIVLAGVLAIGIGLYLYNAIRIDKNGYQFQKYNSASRIHGVIMAFLGCFLFLFFILLAIFK